MQKKDHWESVYKTKAADAVSWFQERADSSLKFIQAAGLPKDAAIIDIGGGASRLVDDLLVEGFSNITVLDLSEAALQTSKNRLGAAADKVRWLAADITEVELPEASVDLWHDRAVFHFLTQPEDREAYVRRLHKSLKPGGEIVISTFAEEGPVQCSGLPVVRYSIASLHAALGTEFELKDHLIELHHTPFGTTQQFIYCRFEK